MNIEYLKYFSELAKIQHYGKAAKALNISQPGLSHAIKSLEEASSGRAGSRTSDGRENGADRQCVSSGTGDDPTYAERVWGNISVYHLQPDDTGDRRRTFGWKI